MQISNLENELGMTDESYNESTNVWSTFSTHYYYLPTYIEYLNELRINWTTCKNKESFFGAYGAFRQLFYV